MQAERKKMLPERRHLPLPLVPMPGEACVGAAAVSESQRRKQKFSIMAHSSAPSTRCWEPRGRTGGAQVSERQQIGWGPSRKGTGAHFRLSEVPDTQEKA